MNNTNAMRTVKVGMMPGRLVEVAIEGTVSVQEVFNLASIEIPSGYEVRMDGDKVELSTNVTGNLLVASKLIKGNATTVKIGTMPGRLVEVAIEGSETIAQVFEIAGIEVLSGYEVRADGDKVELTQSIGNAKLVVQSKLIKGNATIKIGLMPGRLIELVITGEETIGQLFDMAEITLPSGYEIRMDGDKVELSTMATGSLVVGSKLIKGNK